MSINGVVAMKHERVRVVTGRNVELSHVTQVPCLACTLNLFLSMSDSEPQRRRELA